MEVACEGTPVIDSLEPVLCNVLLRGLRARKHFQPFGLWQLFRIPARELPDRSHKREDLLGKVMEELWLRLAECKSCHRNEQRN